MLFVCTGNICRSPFADVVLRARVEALNVHVESAGTHAVIQSGMTRQARDLAVAHGARTADADAHRARILGEPALNQASVILTMTREQRTHAVELTPNRLHRTFTIRELARLTSMVSSEEIRSIANDAGADEGARLDAVLTAVSAQRGRVAAPGDDDDVIDPYRGSDAVYELSISQILPALAEVERLLRESSARSAPHDRT